MKSTFTTCLFLLLGLGMLAQQNQITGIHQRALSPMASFASSNKITSIDTIWTYLDRSTAYYLLSAGATGFVLGKGSVSSETAMHYSALGPAVVTDVIAFFAYKHVLGNADSMMVHVYAAGPDSMPTTMVGSGMFSVADADTSNNMTIIPVMATSVIGDFLISVQYGGGVLDDTLVILSNKPLVPGDGQGEKRCRQLTNQGWLRAAEIWTIAGSPFDADALLIPIVDLTAVGVDNHVGSAGLNLYPSYPNPANSQHNIVWSNDADDNVSIKVYDLHGRTMSTASYNQLGAGKHTLSLSTDSWASGQYYFTVSTNNAAIGSKFVVQH